MSDTPNIPPSNSKIVPPYIPPPKKNWEDDWRLEHPEHYLIGVTMATNEYGIKQPAVTFTQTQESAGWLPFYKYEILLGQFKTIRKHLDSVNLELPKKNKEVEDLKAEVERLRAAGNFAMLSVASLISQHQEGENATVVRRAMNVWYGVERVGRD